MKIRLTVKPPRRGPWDRFWDLPQWGQGLLLVAVSIALSTAFVFGLNAIAPFPPDHR